MCSSATEKRAGIIVQARLGSSRLPGKVLKPLVEGRTVLGYLLERLTFCQPAAKLIVATSLNPIDDPLAQQIAAWKIAFFRGSESDCLERYYSAARQFDLEIVARVTADCPLVIPSIVEEMIQYFRRNYDRIDYLSNRQYTDFPEGLDVEIFKTDLLEEGVREAQRLDEREHINYFFLNRPTRYRLRYYNHGRGRDYSRFKLSIDDAADLDRVRALFSHRGLPIDFTFDQLITALIAEETTP